MDGRGPIFSPSVSFEGACFPFWDEHFPGDPEHLRYSGPASYVIRSDDTVTTIGTRPRSESCTSKTKLCDQ